MAETKEMLTPEYTLRNVEASDVFALVKILRKVGVRNFTKAMSEPSENNAKGFAILDVIIERLPECENEIYDFLSRLTGLKNIEKLDGVVFVNLIYEVLQSPNFLDFLKAALKFA